MPNTAIQSLINTMSRLRADDGCPWDREQTLTTLRSYLIEEAYEVLDAMDSQDTESHLEELGDLLFQIVFQSQIRSEEGAFNFEDVARAIDRKMQRRHPHVFGDVQAADASAVIKNWDELKQEEREAKKDNSRFSGIPTTMPALLRAQRLGEKAARFGLDWEEPGNIASKIEEELKEFTESCSDLNPARQAEEFGDLLFTLVNLARHQGIDAEAALSFANRKFETRARFVEQAVREDGVKTPTELDALWKAAKQRAKSEP